MAVDLFLEGVNVTVVRVVDASTGGVLLELPFDREPPRLSSRGIATLRRGNDVVERGARVVRVRWGGREKGVRVPPAIALVFEDADADAAARLEAMLR